MKNVITIFTVGNFFLDAAMEHGKKLAKIFSAEIEVVAVNHTTSPIDYFSDNDNNRLLYVMPVSPNYKLTYFSQRYARKWIRKSRVPVLVVGDNEPKEQDYQQVVLPLDINCQEKELALWASYFPTYSQKNCPHIPKENPLIHVIYNQYKDELLRQKVQNNIDYVVKLFGSLEVPYQLHPFSKIDNIHIYGLQFAKALKNSVLLYLIPEHYSFIDLFFGPIVKKLLDNKENIPVLCLNARDDLFVLCQ
ncbi:MAG: hypothetical protein LBI45_03825 [Bacteroidales bacterium]|jgi:hypothetical protein|nr:hypothetical protein [Bacteroidales bacterium]